MQKIIIPHKKRPEDRRRTCRLVPVEAKLRMTLLISGNMQSPEHKYGPFSSPASGLT
ncbi:MAG: hypothetical protein RIK87_00235 [Fuerstiella sp.]